MQVGARLDDRLRQLWKDAAAEAFLLKMACLQSERAMTFNDI